jgi:hydrogenase expression/formation protein HypC
MCLAVPMKIVEKTGPETALVESNGASLEVSLQLVENAAVGDYVLIHAGFAIQVLNPAAAEEKLRLFAELAEATRRPM